MTTPTNKKRLKELALEAKVLTDKERSLQQSLIKVRGELRAVRLAHIHEEYGVTVGSIVEAEKQTAGGVRVYKVTQVSTSFSGKPWVTGVRRKMDGTWGSQDRNLYSDWKLTTES